MPDLSGINVVTTKSRAFLNERQVVDYQTQREACLDWLLTFGKNPDLVEGYALGTVKPRAARMDQFYRFVWDHEGRYTANLTHDHADAWMKELVSADLSTAHKDCCQKAVKMLFKWRHHEHGLEEWTPEITFYSRSLRRSRRTSPLRRVPTRAPRERTPRYHRCQVLDNLPTPPHRYPTRASGPFVVKLLYLLPDKLANK